MSNLDKVMGKIRSQRSSQNIPDIEEKPLKKKKKVKEAPEIEEEVPEEEEEEEEDEDEEEEEVDDEDEDGEDEELESKEEPAKEEEPKKKETSEKETKEDIRAGEIQLLQNDGIFRVELLFQLGQMNKSLMVLNTLINKVVGEEDAKK